MIDKIYDKTSKIAFTAYGNDFLEYFGEYRTIIRELGTEIDTLYGKHRRLDKLVLMDDDTLQNWEFLLNNIGEDELEQSWQYNNIKSAQSGKVLDSFIICFANPDYCKESIQIGRSIFFAPIIKYLQKMGLPKELSTIEDKVKNNIRISTKDELTLIFVALSSPDKYKEETVKRVCNVLGKIDYITGYRRVVIDSLISFQIENFVKSKEDQDELNEVVDMQVSVEELFLQVEREAQFDKGYDKGFDEAQDDVILNMLSRSVSDEVIRDYVGCSLERIQKIRNKGLDSS